MPNNELQSDPDAGAKRARAIEIVQKHFSEGLTGICDPQFLAQRYDEFLHRKDPIYVELLKGMDAEPLAKTFVSYWTIAQTLATNSRFWLENSVAEIISAQVKHFGRPAIRVYSRRMLGNGFLERDLVPDLGEDSTEHITDSRPWRPPMKEQALTEVAIVVDEQDRVRVSLAQRQGLHGRRDWDQRQNGEAARMDEECLRRVASAVGGRAISDVTVQCNLLVIEPERKDGKPHVFAIRFINPKTFASHAQRKQERANLLRLYAYLVQEKPFREVESIRVYVAELLPRMGSSFEMYDYYPDYFSPRTYWTSKQLWDFIGVPFDAVSEAIRNVAKDFRWKLIDGLRYLLPTARLPDGWGRDPSQECDSLFGLND